MKKYIVYLIVLILFSIDGYFIYKSINSFRKINTFKKETALVVETKYAKHSTRGRTYYLEMKLKPIASEGEIYDIELSESSYLTFRSLPKISKDDIVTYYLMEDSLLKVPEVIGLSTEKKVRSNFQVFLDIYNCYTKMLYIHFFSLIICGLVIVFIRKNYNEKIAFDCYIVLYPCILFKVFLITLT